MQNAGEKNSEPEHKPYFYPCQITLNQSKYQAMAGCH